ncbi:MAG TPA: hypothetical protein VM120_07495, partial [Bryobacteraceae bacterium]|nr:hypothetical protein [Bryobacteraceae bacterium]
MNVNTIIIAINILSVLAAVAVLIDPKAQRHLAAWLRARAERIERMREHRAAERAAEQGARAEYLSEMQG